VMARDEAEAGKNSGEPESRLEEHANIARLAGE
jgi:hypothetical protein